jgi:hypothetical protein
VDLKRMIEYLENFLKEQKINKKDICIVGSFALNIAKVREANDIDIVLKKEDRKALEIPFNQAIKVNEKIEVVAFGWAGFLGITDDDLIDNIKYHNYFNGYKVVVLDLIIKKKKLSRRKKDYKDLLLLGKREFNDKYFSLNTIKIYFIKFLKRIKKFLKPIYNKIYFNFLKSNTIYNLSLKELILCIPPEIIVSTEYSQKLYSRYDIIVRYITIENLIKKKKYPFNLFNKMQRKRVGLSVDYESNLKDLIYSLRNNGYKLNSTITISKDGHLIDGSHRVAIALFFGVPIISTKISFKRKRVVKYGLDWFYKNKFTKDECDLLRIKKDWLFYRKGIYFYVLLWPTVYKYFNEIKNIISQEYSVYNSKIYLFSNEEFMHLAHKIYEIDDIEKWKVNRKLHAMQKYKKHLMLLWVEFPNPKYRKKEINNSYISTIGEGLKYKIRSKYKNKVPGYIYDTICHTGDNYEHNRKVFEIFNKKIEISPKYRGI